MNVKVARNAKALADTIAVSAPALVLADLDSSRLAAAATLTSLKGALGNAPLIGFFSHVHVERSTEAKAAGFYKVLARSAFVRELPELIRAVAATP